MAPLSRAHDRIRRAALGLFADRGAMQVSVKELAAAAGVARGTVYAHVGRPEAFFEELAAQFAVEMNERVASSFDGLADPAHRLANGIRCYVRRAHEEPHWGRFIVRFAFANAALQQMWNGPLGEDLRRGVVEGRYRFRTAQLPSVVSLVAGSVLGAILVVLEGHQSWRVAGSDTAELVLIALGVPPGEARSLATHDLPVLAARRA